VIDRIGWLQARYVGALGALCAIGIAMALGSAADVRTATSEEYGTYLVDAEGMSLYLFLRDEMGPSTCYDQCADAWPPLLVDADVAPVAGEGEERLADAADADLLSTAERDDGTLQVTYGGWPLYYFAGDEEPGDANGQALNDVWFLVDVSGNAIGHDAAEGEDALFQDLMTTGAGVFSRMCASCHGAEGDQALADRVDIIAGNARTVNNASRLIRRVMHGGSYMPSFGAALSDHELAAVTTFVRNSWGHEFGIITEEEVAEFR